jgi:hypothetical protein
MESDEDRSLTCREFDEVVRRATELSTSESNSGDTLLSEGELFRIAGEVGLSGEHVRRALVEVRGGVEPESHIDRVFGPASIRVSRIVTGELDRLTGEIDDFLVASRLLQPVRRGTGVLQYRPAVDWASQLARAASFTSWKYYIAASRSVDVRLEAVDDGRTLIAFSVDPGMRSEDIGLAVLGGSLGGGVVGALTGLGVAVVGRSVGLAIGAAILVSLGVLTAIVCGFRRSYRNKVKEVELELEGVLDSLERGVSLEPPPASWRRWVRRHFHGVARDRRSLEDE